jgi:hypothetical protein
LPLASVLLPFKGLVVRIATVAPGIGVLEALSFTVPRMVWVSWAGDGGVVCPETLPERQSNAIQRKQIVLIKMIL